MKTKYLRRFKSGLSLGVIVVTAFLLGFEAYTFAVVRGESQTGLPENYGNFERIRNSLTEQGPKDEFSFALVGDTQGTRTFERLCDELRNEPLSFMVILGDFVKTSTRGNHDYFRSRCAKEYRLPFPVFLVAGNRDVVCEEVDYDIDKVSPVDLERMYGPRNFSFEYNGCLFIGLCILPALARPPKVLSFWTQHWPGIVKECKRFLCLLTHRCSGRSARRQAILRMRRLS
ncbi:MAG: metallophosphoesterase [Phycisphaerae bacterium]|nr:metallophosphoesterase [Phycisphaerae bacterium]